MVCLALPRGLLGRLTGPGTGVSQLRRRLSPRHDPARQLVRFLVVGVGNTALRFVAYRLPELFAGLPRAPGSFPVQYLGANVPQAWAASAIFRLVAILCGIHASSNAAGSTLYVNPALPDWLPELTIDNLRAGGGSLSLRFHAADVEILSNTSGFDVVHGPAPRPAAPAFSPPRRHRRR